MANLESLRQRAISQLSDDELTERLREIRLNRRTPAMPSKKKQKAKPTTVLSSSNLIAKLSDAQIAELLEKLTGSNPNPEEETIDGTNEDAGEAEDSSNQRD